MIKFNNVTVRRGPNVLFSEADFTIHKNQRVGITGKNGCGKSTLMSLLKGDLEVDTGSVELPKKLVMAHVVQETPSVNISALDYTLQGDFELFNLREKLHVAEATNNVDDLSVLYEKLENIDGYSADSRANILLNGLGFSEAEVEQTVASFSGGWRVRLNLAQALMCRSDILLLDEPTNHLDLNTVLWLQDWLKKYQGTLLLISHDRDFLNSITTHIVNIEHQKIQMYTGNYTQFEMQRAAQLANQQASYDKQQQEIAHIESFITRFKAKATKSKQAQSRIKQLNKIELISKAHIDSPFKFEFSDSGHLPHNLLELNKASLNYGNSLILKDINLTVVAGDRIALLGANGAGKSTLIKMLAGVIPLSSGELVCAKDITVSYFAQHQIEQLRLEESPLQHMVRLFGDTSEQMARNHLGGFDFHGDKVKEKIEHFSGGEKTRLALAILVYQNPQVLLLDEPTNHLDLDMRHALSIALQGFNGALVIISHDSHLLQTVADKLLVVENQQIIEFDGDFADYAKTVISSSVALKENQNTQTSDQEKSIKQKNTDLRKQRYSITKNIDKLERKMDKTNSQLSELEVKFSDNDLYTEDNKENLLKLNCMKKDLDNKIEALELEWFELNEQLSVIDN